MRICTLATSLLIATFALVGCTTPQPGVSNQFGTLETLVEADTKAVTEAAKDTLEDMDLVIVSSQATAIDGQVIARTAQDKKVTVTAEKAGENLTKMYIRVGTVGDQEVSLDILERIQNRLRD